MADSDRWEQIRPGVYRLKQRIDPEAARELMRQRLERHRLLTKGAPVRLIRPTHG